MASRNPAELWAAAWSNPDPKLFADLYAVDGEAQEILSCTEYYDRSVMPGGAKPPFEA